MSDLEQVIRAAISDTRIETGREDEYEAFVQRLVSAISPEIERLRAALKTIAYDADQFGDVDPDDGLHQNSVRQFARLVLE